MASAEGYPKLKSAGSGKREPLCISRSKSYQRSRSYKKPQSGYCFFSSNSGSLHRITCFPFFFFFFVTPRRDVFLNPFPPPPLPTPPREELHLSRPRPATEQG